jgi:hypothetical protein
MKRFCIGKAIQVRRRRAWLGRLLVLIGLGAAGLSPALAQDCMPQSAPGRFPFRGNPAVKTALPTNVGIVPQGFVSLRGVPTIPGVDVSKWQETTDFVELKKCAEAVAKTGGHDGRHPEAPFVYVRMMAGEDGDLELEYATHWANARNLNLFVGPYHNLDVIDAKVAVSSLSDQAFADLMQVNLATADKQAAAFTDRFARLLRLDPAQDVVDGELGKPYLPITLALSLRPQSKYTLADTAKMGAVYAAAACRWLERIRAAPSFAEQKVLVFTSGYIYRDYGLASAPCDLRVDGIWIGQHTANGDRHDLDPDKDAAKAAKDLCISTAGKDICVIQQYTSYGGFALFRSKATVDLDRFFGTEADLQAMLQHAKHPELWGPK